MPKEIQPSEIPKTGIPEIDAQHAKLMDLYNRLHEWVQRGHAVAAMFDALAALESYVAEHFAFEEKFQEEIGFEGIEEHRARHLELINEFGRYQQAMFEGEDVANQLLGFISNWLKVHTATEDMQFARYFLNAKNGAKNLQTNPVRDKAPFSMES